MRFGTAARLLVALAACGVGVAAADGKESNAVTDRTFSFGPMAIGQAKDLDHARAEGLGVVPASPLDAYLGGVLAKLLAGSRVTQVPARVYVRASSEWSAKSTADANIYVSLGILLRLDNEDEVAALLAHEASHVILGHANSDVVQGVQQRAMQLSALAVDAQRALADATGNSAVAGGQPGGGPRVEEQSRALLLNTTLLSPSWTRGQERAADRLGTDLLVRAGYAPQGMVSLLQKQKSFETERAANPQASSLDQQLMGSDVTQQGQRRVTQATAKYGATSELFGTLAGAALNRTQDWASKQADEGSRSHPKTKERIADVQAYVAQEYGNKAARALRVESWEAAKEADGTVDILENYIAAIEAKGKLADGDIAAARTLAKAGLSGPTATHAYPNYVDAAVQVAGGSTAQALADYEAALSGPEPAGAIYTGASTLLLAAGQRDRALEVMEAGYARLQEPPSLTVPLIRTYRLLGHQADADRLAADCAMRWPTMQSLCADEAAGR
jgi:predicted Zn-dependent protease